MSLALAKNELLFTPPPSFDWTNALIGDDLKNLEKKFDRFEQQSIHWRTAIAGQMLEGLKKVEAAVSELPKDEANKMIVEAVGSVIGALEETLRTFSEPMHANPEIAVRVEQLAKLSNSAGKFVRKLLRRVEKVRVLQHAACVDVYYGLLAFQSEHVEDGRDKKTFSDPTELGAFLRQNMAS